MVSEKVAGVATPVTVAVAEYGPPAVPLAVMAGDAATPDELVVAVAVVPPPAKVPLAPLVGRLNVTDTPPSGFALASLTVALSGNPKALLI